ncbi:hypothetical protein [Methylomonas koyamae]|uniref:hypothetical protein n=1 Tax=Methylomonas koyamae TaxID=702114 RepID=UPI0011288467|nr:hypothetical protein [Methylomonas koyamae]TPQ24963.1 hypothetical protein C2U68_17465 [Methylomonas koyamae]
MRYSSIHGAECLSSQPPSEMLQAKLHEANARSRARLENREVGHSREGGNPEHDAQPDNPNEEQV